MMPVVAWGMIVAGVLVLVAGLLLVRQRFLSAAGVGKILVLGPVFEAVPLAMFAAEHFFLARDISGGVPKWLPGALFWAYFFGVALALAAISFTIWRGVRWAAVGMTAFFFIIVVTLDLPELPKVLHDRLFLTLTLRETVFGCGTLVLAASLWPPSRATSTLMRGARMLAGAIFSVYAGEHFLFPRFVPGVPLGKLTPAWWPGPMVLAYLVGLVLLAAGLAFLTGRMVRQGAALAGAVLAALVVFFYTPILLTELHTPLVVEGLNYVGDTLLFDATALLLAWGVES